MAAVRQCDRCGTLIDYKIYPAKLSAFKQSWIGSMLRLESTIAYSEYDLCKDCTAKLKEFLKGTELVSDTAEHPIFGRLVNVE